MPKSCSRSTGRLLNVLLLGIWLVCHQSTRASEPLEPDAALAAFVLHPACRIELVASEPDVIDPVHIAFAPDGKLWVVEYSDYPNGPAESEPGRSRIRVLTDADGDGRYTNPVTFAEGLLFANGLMHWRDGVIVTTDGKVLFLRDTDGDLVADETQEWFTGFATENPQLRCNHPTLGLDGWIYIANGLRGGSIMRGSGAPWPQPDSLSEQAPLSISGMDFRFHPGRGDFEAITGVGQFGLCFDDMGNRFVCSNRNPCRHLVIDDRYVKRNPHYRIDLLGTDVSPAAEASQLYPLSRTWTTSNLHANQFTAACGVLIYRGSALPGDFYGNSFTCEPTGNLVHRDILTPSGATFRSQPDRDGVEFLATTDEWFRPVNLSHGPDGALYVVDMYRAVIEHPQFMPEELQARPDLLLGTDRGRIWRISRMDPLDGARDPLGAARLDSRQPAQLVSRLSDPNAWQRETAFRLLLESINRENSKAIVPILKELFHKDTDDRATVLAMWLVHLLGHLEASDLAEVLYSDEALPAEQAIIIARQEFETLMAQAGNGGHASFIGAKSSLDALLTQLVPVVKPGDPRERILFQLLWACPAAESSLERLGKLTPVLENWGDDPFFRAAVLSGVTRNAQFLASSLLINSQDPALPWTAARQQALRSCVELTARQEERFDILRLLEKTFGVDSREAPNAGQIMRARTQVLLGLTDAVSDRDRVIKLLRELPVAARNELGESFNAIGLTAIDDTQPVLERQAAVKLLGYDDRESTRLQLVGLLDDPTVNTVAVEALGRSADERLTDLLLARYSRSTPALKHAILQVLSSSILRAERLLSELEAGQILRVEIDPATSQRLLRSSDEAQRQRALKILSAKHEDRLAVIAEYTACLALASDPLRGIDVFKQNCAGCHQVGRVGVNVAPDISDSRVKSAEDLLTHIIDPNRVIDNNYFSYTIVDTQGRILTGIIETETSAAITLKQPEGKRETIARSDIEEMKSNGVSLMPVGLEKKISQQQMADLIAYLKGWRYLDGQIPGVGGNGSPQ